MIFKLFLILPLLFGLPQVGVNWKTPSRDLLDIQVLAHDPILFQCKTSGLEAQYRYDMRLCRHRSMWFDRCKADHTETRSLQWDPISENFRITSDRHGDEAGPSVSHVVSFDEALDEISNVRDLQYSYLSDNDQKFAGNQSSYLRVRVSFFCKGQNSRTLDRLSSILTLGLVSMSSSDSGWIDFTLDR